MTDEPQEASASPSAIEGILDSTVSLSNQETQDIDQLLQTYNLEPGDHKDAERESVTSQSFSERAKELTEMEQKAGGREATWAQLAEHRVVEYEHPEFSEHDREIGAPGTRFWDGRLRQETTQKYRPYNLRGRMGNPGLLEDQYRQETVVRSSVDSIVEIQKSATRRIAPPPSKHFQDEELHEEVRQFTQKLNTVFRNLESNQPNVSGLDEYVSDTANSVALFGFAPAEVVWRDREQIDIDGPVPTKVAFREPQTVERWVMDAKLSRLLAVDFKGRASDTSTPDYSLPARGPRLEDQRVILARISGRGTNWEGVAPARSAEHWIKFKQLLGQIVAATAQKYGVPTTYIRLDPSFFKAMPTPSDADGDDIKELVNKLDVKEAIECAIVGLPGGLMAEEQSPSGPMPEFENLIRYCDEQIAKCYNNEGSLLSGNQLGSYAMAEVAENRFLRSAPMYSGAIMGPLDALVRGMVKRKFGLLPAYPRWKTQFAALQDTETFIRNLDTLFAPNTSIPDWPKTVRREVEQRMDVPEGTFDEAPGDKDVRPGEQDAAPRPSERRGTGEVTETQLKENQVDEPHRHDFPPADKPRGPAPGLELQDPTIDEDFDPDRAEELLKSAEEEAIEEIRRLLEQQKDAFAGRTENATDVERLEVVSKDLRDIYAERLKEPIRQMAIREASAGVEHLAESFGIDVGGVELQEVEAPLFEGLDWLDARNRPKVRAATLHMADELASRNVGKLRQDKATTTGSDEEADLSALKAGAVALVVERMAGVAYNAGRDQIIRDAQAGAAGDTIEVEGEEVEVKDDDFRAVRSSMLDGNVCRPCLSLDHDRGGPTFVVGSQEYFANHPPKKCVTTLAGRPRCRCLYIHWDPHGGEAIKHGLEKALL